jgi:small-conductance mechanosensitive channel
MQSAQVVPRFSLEFLEVASPSTWQLILAALILIAIWLVGAVVGRLAGHRLDERLASHPGSLFRGYIGHNVALLRNLTTSIILMAIFQRMAILDPLRHLMIAGVLSLAVTQTVFHFLRGLQLSVIISTALATAAFVGTLLITLGSYGSVLEALELIGISFGKSRISLLDIADYLLVVIAILVTIRIAIALISQSLSSSTALDLYQRTLVQKVANIIVVLVGGLIGLGLLGIDFAALAIFSGALGLGIGVSLQKVVGNLLAGLSLLLDRSIKPGDVIVIGYTFGSVTQIGARAVSVVTRDGQKYLIPNEKLMTETVENWSYFDPNVRLRIPVGVPHGCDIHVAKQLMLQAAAETDRVLATPEPVCRLKNFGLSTVEFELNIWIRDPHAGIGNIRSDILTRTWDLFRDNGIILPLNPHDVFIHGDPTSKPTDD